MRHRVTWFLLEWTPLAFSNKSRYENLESLFDIAYSTRHHMGPTAQTSHVNAGDPTQEDGMFGLVKRLWCDDSGQDIAEYAVMLAVILVLVVGTVRLIGSNANTAFSEVASSVQ